MTKLKKSRKKSKKVKTSKSVSTPKARFQSEWERVQRLIKQNERLRDDLAEFVERVRADVQPAEDELTRARIALLNKLIGYIGKKTLKVAVREELCSWVDDIIFEMECNPFCDDSLWQPMEEFYNQQLEVWESIEKKKFENKLIKKGYSEDKIKELVDEIETSDFDEDDLDIDDEFEAIFEEFFGADDEFTEQFQHYSEIGQAENKQKELELDQLLRATPILQLFRRIARTLHPDLEQDETQKENKNKLMSRLIEARDQKDIGTIISMYIEHVGDMPEGLFEGNFEKMTQLLKHQTNKLRAQKEAIMYENLEYAAVWTKFSGKNHRDTQNRIDQYLKHNLDLAQGLMELNATITSVATLTEHVENRLDEQYKNEYDYSDIPF